MNAPVAVLVARLEHELETARLHAETFVHPSIEAPLLRAIEIAKQLREAV